MKITLDMSISKLLDAFDREFGVSLGIYKGAHKSDNIKLFEISDPRKNQKAFIVINKDTSVESAEAMFRNTFGIRVQVKDKNGNTPYLIAKQNYHQDIIEFFKFGFYYILYKVLNGLIWIVVNK